MIRPVDGFEGQNRVQGVTIAPVVDLPDYEPLTGTIQNNADLMLAFPQAVRTDALEGIARLPQTRLSWTTVPLFVGGEAVAIPYRIYHNPARVNRTLLTHLQNEILDCLLTRHHSGYVREEYLRRVIGCNHPWVPPFVVQLLGEYVIEILRVIKNGVENLDRGLYREFIRENPQFFALTKQRVVSYWDCYHRTRHKQGYVGFEVLKSFDEFLR
jgi:hypothetical protein